MRSNSASLTSSRGRLRWVVPALLTMTSMRPCASSVRRTSAATSASTDTSPVRNDATPPAARISCATRSPFSAWMSLTTTVAPSDAKRLAMPSPNPEPAPVTIAILRSSRRLPMAQYDRLERGEAVERLEALLPPVARMLDPSERELDAAARAVAVHEHLAAADGAREPQRSRAIAGPHARDEPVRGRVGEPDRVAFVVEWHDDQHGTE